MNSHRPSVNCSSAPASASALFHWFNDPPIAATWRKLEEIMTALVQGSLDYIPILGASKQCKSMIIFGGFALVFGLVI